MFLCKTAKEDTVEARVESVQVGTTHMTNARLCLKQQNRHRLWVTETHPQVQAIGCGSHCCLSLSLGAFGMLQTCRETALSSQDKTTSWTKQRRAPFHLSKIFPSPIKEQVLRFRWTPEPGESSCAAGKLSGEEAGAWVVGPQQQLLFFHSTDLLDALKSCNVTWTLKCVWEYDISFFCWEILPESLIRFFYISPPNSGTISNSYQPELQKLPLLFWDWLWTRSWKQGAELFPKTTQNGEVWGKLPWLIRN